MKIKFHEDFGLIVLCLAVGVISASVTHHILYMKTITRIETLEKVCRSIDR